MFSETSISTPQTIEGPGGLQLVVSVEKNGQIIHDPMDEPPILDAPITTDEGEGFNEDDTGEDQDGSLVLKY